MTPTQLYRERRRAGLCGGCGKPSPKFARCDECRRVLNSRAAAGLNRIGLGGVPATHQEIGDVLHLSRQRVHQIEHEAIDKMARRLGLSRTDVLQGLATLGVLYGETVDTRPPEDFRRGQHVRARTHLRVGVA